MIFDFLLPKYRRMVRHLGFETDQKGIVSRYTREREGWNVHLQNTKQFIVQAAQNSKKDTVLVLGSGWWLDVPVPELSQMFANVVLVDIVQPQQIRHKAKRYGNVLCVEADITGSVSENIYNSRKTLQRGNKIPLTELHFDTDFSRFCTRQPDLVVSVNLLSQLDVLLTDYLKTYNVYSPDELQQFGRAIQQAHVQAMPKGRSCLVTDVEELNFDKNNQHTRTYPLVGVELPVATHRETWQWQFDTRDTYREGEKVCMNVVGITF